MIVDVELVEVCGNERPGGVPGWRELRCGLAPGHDGMHREGGVSWAGESVEDEAHRLAVAAAIENGGRVPGHEDVDEHLADVDGVWSAGCSCGWRGRSEDVDAHRDVCPLPDLDDERAELLAVVDALPMFRQVVTGTRAVLQLASPRSDVEHQLAQLAGSLCDTHEALLHIVDQLVRQLDRLTR